MGEPFPFLFPDSHTNFPSYTIVIRVMPTLKRLLFSLLCSLLLAACHSGNKFSLKGTFKHLENGEFYLFSTDPAWQEFDTVRVENGKFNFSCELTDTLVMTMQYPNFMQMQIVAMPGGTVQIKGDANNLRSVQISGGDDNHLLTVFRHATGGQSNRQQTNMAEAFIRRYPGTFAAEAVLDRYFLSAEDFDAQKLSEFLSLMKRAAPGRPSVRRLNSRYASTLRTREGQILPAFKARSLKGTALSDSSFRGKYLLIWFWSTWNTELAYPVTHLRSAMRPYNGKVQTLSVSLDADSSVCLRQIKLDSIPAHVVCDRLSWRSPLVQAFGIRSLPAAILVDPKGKIVLRAEEEGAVIEKLRKIFP